MHRGNDRQLSSRSESKQWMNADILQLINERNLRVSAPTRKSRKYQKNSVEKQRQASSEKLSRIGGAEQKT